MGHSCRLSVRMDACDFSPRVCRSPALAASEITLQSTCLPFCLAFIILSLSLPLSLYLRCLPALSLLYLSLSQPLSPCFLLICQFSLSICLSLALFSIFVLLSCFLLYLPVPASVSLCFCLHHAYQPYHCLRPLNFTRRTSVSYR